jgi:hypothetical protein
MSHHPPQSRFWVIWSSSTAPISRYPDVRFVGEDGGMVTVRLYEEFKRNRMFLSGGEFVYPVVLPFGKYTVMASTEPTHSRRVRVSKWYDVCSAVVRFDRAAGRPGQLAVSLVEVGGSGCQRPEANNPEGEIHTVGFAVAGPSAVEREPRVWAECPDTERAQQHRAVREMVTKGQVAEGSAEAVIFAHPIGADPSGPLEVYGAPDYFESGKAWG